MSNIYEYLHTLHTYGRSNKLSETYRLIWMVWLSDTVFSYVMDNSVYRLGRRISSAVTPSDERREMQYPRARRCT